MKYRFYLAKTKEYLRELFVTDERLRRADSIGETERLKEHYFNLQDRVKSYLRNTVKHTPKNVLERVSNYTGIDFSVPEAARQMIYSSLSLYMSNPQLLNGIIKALDIGE